MIEVTYFCALHSEVDCAIESAEQDLANDDSSSLHPMVTFELDFQIDKRHSLCPSKVIQPSGGVVIDTRKD